MIEVKKSSKCPPDKAINKVAKIKPPAERSISSEHDYQQKTDPTQEKNQKKIEEKTVGDQPRPMFSASNIHYDLDGRQQGISHGGIGIIHLLSNKIGLNDEINNRLELLKRHLPYHESDHVSNIVYNIMAGGSCLEDIELLRNDQAWLDALGAEIIPDPTTAGDFLRQFDEESIMKLMEIKNTIREKIWQRQPKAFRKEGVINIDGTICETTSQCKQGMDISYTGRWGCHPLIISLANSREPLYIVNRSGNISSHLDAPQWLDQALNLVGNNFDKVRLRGDTDFSLTAHFDQWDKQCVFVFGVDAMANLVKIADALDASDWSLLEKKPKYTAKTKRRNRPENVKEQRVKQRAYKNLQTECEHIAEFRYQPGKCEKAYRMIVLKKTIKVLQGELRLFDDTRYFFYITNDWTRSAEQIVAFYRDRADHENDIEQLKNGVKALHMPVDNLLSNWAYMVIASLAWDLKAWYGLLLPYRTLGLQVVRMEFKRFINTFMRIPCLIIKGGHRICYRLVGYNTKLNHILNFATLLKSFEFT